MIRQPPRSTRTETLFPYTQLFRSWGWIALLQDDLGRAANLYRESLSLSWDAGMNPLVQMALEGLACVAGAKGGADRVARLWGAAQALHERSEEHTSELQSLMRISYAVFCLKT